MNAAGRRAKQAEDDHRVDPPPESASQFCDVWQTFSGPARLNMRSISLPTAKKRVEAVRQLTDPIGVGGDVTISPWLQTVLLLHGGIDIKLMIEPHFPRPVPHITFI